MFLSCLDVLSTIASSILPVSGLRSASGLHLRIRVRETHFDVLPRLSDQRSDDSLPAVLQMPLLGFPAADRDTDALLATDRGLCQHDLVLIVRPLDESRVELVLDLDVSRRVQDAEDNEREASRREELDSGFALDDRFEVPGEVDEFAQVGAEPVRTERPQDVPDLERTESTTERDLPVSEVDDEAGRRLFSAEIERCHIQSAREELSVSDPAKDEGMRCH